MWFKNGLKAQKLLAQGIALGIEAIKSPCKGKSFINYLIFKSFCPYRATCLRPYLPRVLPWARSFCPFRARGGSAGHEGSKSLRVIIIFKPLRFRSFPVIKDFGFQKYPSTSLYRINKVKSSSPCQQNPSISSTF